MSRVFYLLLVLAVLAGCQESADLRKEFVDVEIAGGRQFPEFLVGTWKADNHGWEIVFEPDGTISSVVHTTGRVRLKPGEVTIVQMKEGGRGTFEAGRWYVQYSLDGELTVEILLDHFRTELGENVVSGKSKDILTGPVQDNKNEWHADWYSYPEFVVFTDEYENYKLPVDPNETAKGTLIFTKVEQTNN